MISLGFLTIKRHQELAYFTEVATALKGKGLSFFRFTPLDIDPSTELVHGLTYNESTEEWESDVFPIPDYLYDRCFYQPEPSSKKAEPIVKWLKQRPGTCFLGYGLPNKWEVYQSICEQNSISSYLPTTIQIENFQQLKTLLRKEKSIMIKPVNGSQGNGVIHIQLLAKEITVHTQKRGKSIHKSFANQLDFKRFIDSLLRETSFIGQNFLPLQHKEKPFDIRILLQKNEQGDWIEQGRGVRMGCEKGIVSNLHNGGEVIPFPVILSYYQSPIKELIQEEINSIIKLIPPLLEERFGRLFELGLDIGVTEEGAVWLLDINSKPGRKVITSSSPTSNIGLYQAPYHYIHYMEQQKTKTN
ncbi:glutathione synthase/RimK-type ligase-like ATP-grasp enzyme [Bacillus mesophilus]|uniref:YheC/YheD family protein n=1 Tax=Bacillus mesophilus TaxID=1808955 RepID=A0A6M0Q3N3_9BACI|nr:YheC/YheD family protein [Bacillus mesophilus]MBM7659951.1 glutathione synthase/RimK-type ligase-like ATP-grasp enzyme [Bacillus mesophilus]NEY70812.1 YheC/YheD family protein [Bacillus mesophilus]